MFAERVVLGTIDYIIFGFMLLVSAGIGIYFRFSGGKQKTTEEYLMAGKDMSIIPVAFSLMASFLSAITVIGTPADIYTYGTYLAFLNIGSVIGIFISAYVCLPVFFNLQVSTAYEYLERRFGRLTRTFCSLAFVAQMILYIAAVLYAPALALSAVTNLSTWLSVISIGVVCTFYCTLGGMKAVIWTDVFQAILMYLGIFAVIIKGCIDVGIGTIFQRATDGGRLAVPNWEFDFTTRYTWWNLLLQGIILSMSAFASNQVQVQRLLTVKTITKSRAALFVSIPMGVGFHLLNCFTGIIIYAVYYQCDPMSSPAKPIDKADKLMPFYMMTSLADYPGLPGLCICGIFSASLSTVSSAVNSMSAVTIEDFVRPFLKLHGFKQNKAAFLTKSITLFYGALCVALTFLVAKFGNLVQSALTIFGMFGGPVLAVFCLGMLTKRSNEKGVLFGIVSSIIFCAWISFGASSYGPRPVKLPVSTEECSALNMGADFNDTTSLAYNLFNVTNTPSYFTTVEDFSESPFSLNISAASIFNKMKHDDNDRYIFPLYRIAYMWVTTIGFFTCIVVGYFSSIIITLCTGKKNIVPEESLSPTFLRFFKETVNEKPLDISPPLHLNVLSDNEKKSEVLNSHQF